MKPTVTCIPVTLGPQNGHLWPLSPRPDSRLDYTKIIHLSTPAYLPISRGFATVCTAAQDPCKRVQATLQKAIPRYRQNLNTVSGCSRPLKVTCLNALTPVNALYLPQYYSLHYALPIHAPMATRLLYPCFTCVFKQNCLNVMT